MIRAIHTLPIAAVLACGFTHAEPVYTTPVGYTTFELAQGFNALGITLHTPTLTTGDFETVTGTELEDTTLSFSPVSGRTYILEINSGSLAGTIQEVNIDSVTGNTITTPDDLGALGLQVGDEYSIRVAPTLEEIFTTVSLANGGVLAAALSSGLADIVWVPDRAGGYNQYYLRSGGSPEFRNVATNTASPNVPVIYSDGFYVQKKTATAATLTVSGELKTRGTKSVAVQGFNLLSPVAPTGLNLFNAGLEATLAPALTAGLADVVWVQQPNLAYVQYFRRSGSGAGWRVVGTTTTLTQQEAEAISLDRGFLIQRKTSSAINVNLNVPAGYNNL